MIKKLCLCLALMVLLCLCSCGVADQTNSIGTQDTTDVVNPTDSLTTDVVDPTDPPVKQFPTVPVVQGNRISLTDNVPEYDINSTDTIIMESHENSQYFTSSYIHLPKSAASGRPAYDGGVFWICDEVEMRQGSHYSSHIVQNGQLQPLQKYSFAKSFFLKGRIIRLEMEYSLLENEVLINYLPDMETFFSDKLGTIVDTSRGVHECLAQFRFATGDDNKVYYYVKVDLETGELTDFLSDFDENVFREYTKFKYWCENDSFIVTKGYESLENLYCYDMASKTLKEYKPEHEQYDARLDSYKEVPDGLICKFDYYDGETLVETRLWKISFADGSMTPVLNEIQLGSSIHYNENYVLYQDSNKMYHMYNINSNQHFSFPDMQLPFQWFETMIIYIDLQGDYYVCDVLDGETIKLEYSEKFDRITRYWQNCSGRKVASWIMDSDGVYQIVVFDADTNTLIELQRTRNAGIEDRIGWDEKKDELILWKDGTMEKRDFVIYDFD